jgi:hypothetical protein
MAPTRRVTRWLAPVLFIAAALGLALFTASQVADRGETVSGVVLDAAGPVAGVTVRIQGRTTSTLTDDEGRFELSGLAEGAPVTVSAWKADYYCAKVDGVLPPATDVVLTLRLVQTNDNPDYEWILPRTPARPSTRASSACTTARTLPGTRVLRLASP